MTTATTATTATAMANPDRAIQRRLEWCAVAGFFAWGLTSLLPLHPAFGVAFVERLILLGPLVVAPLALAGLHPGPPPSRWPRLFRRMISALVLLQLPAALLTMVAVMRPIGAASAMLCAPWLAWSAAAALLAGLRALDRRLLPLSELAVDVAFLHLPVGAIWLMASRAGFALLGFDPVIVTLTAAHFHFAGLAAPTIAALVGRRLRGSWPRTYAVSALIVVATPMIVALGILGSPVVEVISAVILAAGVVGMAALMLVTARRGFGESRGASVLVALAALVSLFTMTLAVLYAVGEYSDAWSIDIFTMAETHGALNVLGFALPALVGLHMLESRPTQTLPD